MPGIVGRYQYSPENAYESAMLDELHTHEEVSYRILSTLGVIKNSGKFGEEFVEDLLNDINAALISTARLVHFSDKCDRPIPDVFIKNVLP